MPGKHSVTELYSYLCSHFDTVLCFCFMDATFHSYLSEVVDNVLLKFASVSSFQFLISFGSF